MSKDYIIFLCHGNICRSPMAQFIFLAEINKRRLSDKYEVDSMAVSYEEEGNDIDYRAKQQMNKNHIPFSYHQAHRISKEEFLRAKVIYTMDQSNIYYLQRIFPDFDHSKVRLLNHPYEISDPWYTHDFDLAFNEIRQSIVKILDEGNL